MRLCPDFADVGGGDRGRTARDGSSVGVGEVVSGAGRSSAAGTAGHLVAPALPGSAHNLTAAGRHGFTEEGSVEAMTFAGKAYKAPAALCARCSSGTATGGRSCQPGRKP
jgi:hypothetical protein